MRLGKILGLFLLLCLTTNVWAASELREYPFSVTTDAVNTFSFHISPRGTFRVNCGSGGTLSAGELPITDGTTFTKPDTNSIEVICSYNDIAARTIGIARVGDIVEYTNNNMLEFMDVVPTIYFYSDTVCEITGVSGSLGAVFPTLDHGINRQPNFYLTFAHCHKWVGSIPENLFQGIHGAPIPRMFGQTFKDCDNLTGNIPSGLFAGLSGDPALKMFVYTFRNCSKLSGPIPEDLFSGIVGAPADGMFEGTFDAMAGLTGYVPYELFAGIEGIGESAISGFDGIFSGTDSMLSQCPSGTQAIIKPALFGDAAFCRCYVNHGTSEYVCDKTVSQSAKQCGCRVASCDDGYQKNNNMCDAIEYSITYELNGGTNNSANPSKYTIESAITLGEPTRDGYVFDGWYENANFTGSAVTGIASGSTGNKTFWAKWSPSETPGASEEPEIQDNPDNQTETETPGGTDAPDDSPEPNVPGTPGDTGGSGCVDGKTRACADGKSVQRCQNGQWGTCAPAYFINIVK